MPFTPPHGKGSPQAEKKDSVRTATPPLAPTATPPSPRRTAAPPLNSGNALPAGERTNPPEIRPASRVQSSYRELAHAAIGLNAASDELGKAIGILDAALKKLNLGLSAWVTLSSNDGTREGQSWWWSRDLGYAKVRDKWGIALRTASGDYSHPDDDSEETSLFSEAPRWMRTEAIGKIPDLLESLLKQTQDTTKAIEKKTAQALELAAAIDATVSDSDSVDRGR